MKIKGPIGLILFVVLLASGIRAPGQSRGDSLSLPKSDTGRPAAINDTGKGTKRPIADTSAIVRKKPARSRVNTVNEKVPVTDTLTISSNPAPIDSLSAGQSHDSLLAIPAIRPGSFITSKVLSRNRFINTKDDPVYLIEEIKSIKGKEFLFYSLCIIVLILGIFKTFYSGYFKNLFRVYFNTSLRQTQLADQLIQAKLPSFILNIFFAVTTGMYIWLLFNYYHPPRLISSRMLLPFCILTVALLYFIKFCIIKFMGWVSDIQQTTDNYIFAIFLINKIIGILLVPVIILLAFLGPGWTPVITHISVMMLGLFFLSRYVKSYGALEKKMPLNPFHFVIYIAGAEIIPLILLYKVAVDYLL
jgi:hypothetical protein